MRIVVLGAGAIGSLFGARLAEAGESVLLVGRPVHAAAIRHDGLIVEGVRPVSVRVEATDRLPSPFHADAVLVSVKTYDLEEAGALLARAAPAPLPVLAPQNGLGVEETLASGLAAGGWAGPERFIVRAVHSVPATLVGPGRVRQAGDGEILLPAHPAGSPEALERWIGLVKSMGYPIRRVEEFGHEVWRKTLLNAAINPVTADHGVENGRLARDPWRGQALELLEEARRVAEVEGIVLSSSELTADLWRVVRATAGNRSSMLQDLDRGRRTEIDHISGRLLALGIRHGLDLPATRRIVERIHRRERETGGPHLPNGPPPQPSSPRDPPRSP